MLKQVCIYVQTHLKASYSLILSCIWSNYISINEFKRKMFLINNANITVSDSNVYKSIKTYIVNAIVPHLDL